MSRPLRLGLAGSLVLALPLVPWAAFLLTSGPPVGTRVEGRPVGEGEVLGRRAAAWLSTEVVVRAGDVEHRKTREELGARVDVARLTREVAALGRSGNPLRDLPALWSAWSGETDLRWPVRVEESAARAYVRELAQEADHPPRPAQLDLDGRLLALSEDGARVRRAEAVRVLVRALREGRRTIDIPIERTSSGVGERALPPIIAQRAQPIVIGRYTTRFRTRGAERDRAHNVATAASYLDGATLPAGGRLSFNGRVGARDRGHGYRDAHVIVGGEMVDGIGGGVCQVASTLHAAAFLAGLDVEDHTPHSRPSEYIPMGLDATVVWPRIDLVLANPFPFPVTVRATTEEGALTVELFGLERVRRVDWRTRVLSTEPFADRYVEDASIPEGEQRVSQAGIRGFVVERSRTIEDGRGLRVERRRLRYPATDRIVRVAPGNPLLAAGPIPDNPF